MHPELFMRVYRQQERELEQRLRHRLAAAGRAPAAPARHHGLRLHLRAHRPTPHG